MLTNAANPTRVIYSSKATGEPPYFLGASVYFAIKNAIYAYREAQGLCKYYLLESPATVERIRMACADELTKIVVKGGELEHANYRAKGSF